MIHLPYLRAPSHCQHWLSRPNCQHSKAKPIKTRKGSSALITLMIMASTMPATAANDATRASASSRFPPERVCTHCTNCSQSHLSMVHLLWSHLHDSSTTAAMASAKCLETWDTDLLPACTLASSTPVILWLHPHYPCTAANAAVTRKIERMTWPMLSGSSAYPTVDHAAHVFYVHNSLFTGLPGRSWNRQHR